MVSIWSAPSSDTLELDLRSARGQERERLVWHYTNKAALESIVTNHTFWATDYRFLNDRDELRVGARRIRQAFDRLQEREEGLDPSEPRLDLERLKEALDEAEGAEHDGSAFLTSFSDVGDSTDQWKSYAGAKGFAIGIVSGVRMPVLGVDTPGLPRFTYVEEMPLRWVSLLYGKAQQLKEAERGLFEVLEQAETADYYIGADDDFDVPSIFNDRATSMYVDAVASAKNKAFRSERERRYVVSRPRNPAVIHQRPKKEGSSSMVPFLKITGASDGRFDSTWDRLDADTFQATPSMLPIRQVRMGPGRNREKMTRWLRKLLDDNGYADVRIRKSHSPLR